VVNSCDKGWCFGTAFETSEGWIEESRLSSIPLTAEPQENNTNVDFYSIASFDTMSGTGTATTKFGTLLKKTRAWTLGLGGGRRWVVANSRLLEAELSVGFASERRQSLYGDKILSSGPWVGTALKYYGRYNEDFGYGGALRVMVKLFQPRVGFETAPSRYLIAGGPLITHETGLSRPSTMLWRPYVAFSSKEIFFGLGAELSF